MCKPMNQVQTGVASWKKIRWRTISRTNGAVYLLSRSLNLANSIYVIALKSSSVSFWLNCIKINSLLRTSDGPCTTSAFFCDTRKVSLLLTGERRIYHKPSFGWWRARSRSPPWWRSRPLEASQGPPGAGCGRGSGAGSSVAGHCRDTERYLWRWRSELIRVMHWQHGSDILTASPNCWHPI